MRERLWVKKVARAVEKGRKRDAKLAKMAKRRVKVKKVKLEAKKVKLEKKVEGAATM